MPVFSKNMLLGACVIADTERDDRALGVVVLEADGTIVARNRSAIYVAEPALQTLSVKLKLNDTGLDRPVAIHAGTLAAAVKTIPVDKQFKGVLEHITIHGPAGAIRYQHPSATGTLPAAEPNANAFGNWRQNLADFIGVGSGCFSFNRKRLMAVITAIETACKYDGEFAYIEQKPVQNGLVWTAKNELYNAAVLVAFTAPKRAENRQIEGWLAGFFEGSKQAPDRSKPKIMLTRRGS